MYLTLTETLSKNLQLGKYRDSVIWTRFRGREILTNRRGHQGDGLGARNRPYRLVWRQETRVVKRQVSHAGPPLRPTNTMSAGAT